MEAWLSLAALIAFLVFVLTWRKMGEWIGLPKIGDKYIDRYVAPTLDPVASYQYAKETNEALEVGKSIPIRARRVFGALVVLFGLLSVSSFMVGGTWMVVGVGFALTTLGFLLISIMVWRWGGMYQSMNKENLQELTKESARRFPPAYKYVTIFLVLVGLGITLAGELLHITLRDALITAGFSLLASLSTLLFGREKTSS